MKIFLFVFGVSLINCSSTSPSNPPSPTNWSLTNDPILWQTTNPYTQNFISAWGTNGLSDAINQIGAATWSTAIGSLKNNIPFKNITSFSGYDRKALDAQGNPINANCSTATPGRNGIPLNATQAWQCNIYAQNPQGEATAAQCYFYKMTSTSATQLVGNSCTITSKTSCQINSAYTNGFSCSSWNKTTVPLSSINLQLKNLYDSSNVIGCMSPATIVNTLTQWGGLGIGNQITYEDPSVVAPTEQPTYLDAAIMYANPYNNDNISGLNPPFADYSTNHNYSILTAWNTFCSQNTGFCQAGVGGTSTGGLAHIVGQAGPIALSKYVQNLKQANPTGYYTWQYDDAAGQTICNSGNSRAIGIFCPGSVPLDATTTGRVFEKTDSRFAVYNNCPDDIWVQAKPVPASPPVPAYCKPGDTTPNVIVNATDCLVHLPTGYAHVYHTPAAGLQSFNIWSKTGCDATGFNCKTGEINDNGQASGNSRPYGPQPDIETAIEGTFGCTLTDTSGCQQTQNGNTLGSQTYLDVTFVNGFTRPAQLQILRGSDETHIACLSTPTPSLDISLCPTNEDLTTIAKPN